MKTKMQSVLEYTVAHQDEMLKLKHWLEGPQCKCFDVEGVVLTLGNQRWYGCRYKQNFEAPSGSRNPGPYTMEHYYFIGKLPKYKKYRKSACMRIAGPDDADYYVSGYADEKAAYSEQTKAYHPFGLSWMMAKWDHVALGSRIDSYERFAYVRHTIEVDFVAL